MRFVPCTARFGIVRVSWSARDRNCSPVSPEQFPDVSAHCRTKVRQLILIALSGVTTGLGSAKPSTTVPYFALSRKCGMPEPGTCAGAQDLTLVTERRMYPTE